MQQPIEGKGLLTYFRPHIHLSEDRDGKSSHQYRGECGQHDNPTLFSFYILSELPLQ